MEELGSQKERALNCLRSLEASANAIEVSLQNQPKSVQSRENTDELLKQVAEKRSKTEENQLQVEQRISRLEAAQARTEEAVKRLTETVDHYFNASSNGSNDKP